MALSVLAMLAAGCGGSGSSAAKPSTSGPSSTEALQAVTSTTPANLDSTAVNDGGAGLQVSGALSGTLVAHGDYRCIPVQAIAGSMNGREVELGVNTGNGRISFLMDVNDNPVTYGGTSVSVSGSTYVFNAKLQAGLAASGTLTLSGSLPCR